MAVEKSGPGLSYEDTRKQRMEENKRRMEELGLMDLSKELKGSKQKKPLKRKMHSLEEAGLESRRSSSRVASKPAVSYKDQLDMLPGMRARCGTRERQGLGRRYVSDIARREAFEAAEEAFKDMKNPGFVKAMLHSHVSSCFWLGLPLSFCKQYMPREDERFILEDDKGKEWECLYLAHKTGMSGGWRGFSLDHELVDGDSCIFELVKPLRFKVHFFRCEDDGSGEVDEKGMGVKVEGEDTKTPKKASKVVTKKKAGSSKARKLSKSSKKLKVEDEEDNEESDEDDEDNEESDEDDEDDYAPRVSKKDADTNVAGPSRASRRKLVKKENDDDEGEGVEKKSSKEMESGKQKGKRTDDLIELESGEDEDEDKDALKLAAVSKTNQGGPGNLSSGRATRNSLRGIPGHLRRRYEACSI